MTLPLRHVFIRPTNDKWLFVGHYRCQEPHPHPHSHPPHTSWWADVESKQTSRQRRKLQNSAKSWVEKLSKEGVGDSKPSSRQGRGSREDNGHETWKEVKAAGGCALLGLWESMWVHREQLRKEMSFEGKKLSRQGHSERAHIPSSVLNQGRKSHSNASQEYLEGSTQESCNLVPLLYPFKVESYSFRAWFAEEMEHDMQRVFQRPPVSPSWSQ